MFPASQVDNGIQIQILRKWKGSNKQRFFNSRAFEDWN